MCVPTNAGSEGVAIGLPKCIDAGVASFVTDLPAAFTFAIIEAGSSILSSSALSDSFLWHVTLIFNSSEPEPDKAGLGSINQSANAYRCVHTSECSSMELVIVGIREFRGNL